LAVLTYEIILMLDPDGGEEQRDKLVGDVKSKLESSGEILHEANWGIRKMAYLIDKHESSDYRFFRFNGDKPLLDDLSHSLKITDGILRFRIFKVDADAPIVVPPDTEQIMRRDDDERGGRREGRGPRRPRSEDESSADEPAATPAETVTSAPAEPTATPEPATPAERAAAAAGDAE
jgi:small subunit ribosomal protein S6